jgi:energy-coupling factor transport system permease protein
MMALMISFGQYLPGTTPVHACDARVKLIIVIAFTCALFASSTWWALVLLGALTGVGYVVARVPFKVAAQGLKPLAIILLFTVAANAFTLQAPLVADAIVLAGSFGCTPTGLLTGLYFALRICLLVLGTSLITFTTTMVALIDALTMLMKPLRTFHVPVDDAAAMFSIALRFIPLTAEEADKVIMAQRVRGVRFGEGGLVKRTRKWGPVLIPLFVGLFRRADELASAMEARCYTGEGRTRLNEPVMVIGDWVALFLLVALCIAIALLF